MLPSKKIHRFESNNYQSSSLEQLFPNDLCPTKITLQPKLLETTHQDHARRILDPHGLWPSWPLPENEHGTPRWGTSDLYREGQTCYRYFHCRSGTDPAVAAQPPTATVQGRSTQVFSGCLAHVHITCKVVWDKKDKEDFTICGPILAIHGILEHSEGCNKVPFHGASTHPHPTIKDMAIQELRVGIPASRILANNAMYLMTDTNDQFKLGITSPAMCKAVWQCILGQLLLMESMLGVCLQNILLCVMLVIVENYKGVPIALFLFSAPLGNRQTSAGYDGKVLDQFLLKWRAALGEKDGAAFTPKIPMTHTDLKEINALRAVWYGTIVPLCIFHISQSWKNQLSKELGQGSLPEVVAMCQLVAVDVHHVLQRIMQTPIEADFVPMVTKLEGGA
ncbi:hypothetical protein BDK51DRAFT_45860 [Blyttiomyces helicus]|uniref:MULE transposase domain-containing protein n=1 Tax=Blyttiomyces helicus TaxID=388810 RepID=A0A4P9WB99_9FUNG|nr:hypothetical protein BDK51DRAFT_45860 [Blyttiomyces helicus]|eukprot:RKO89889.1 hypothetical protein BDK51DRAFT_45860 [Blyttiomyces helicus]